MQEVGAQLGSALAVVPPPALRANVLHEIKSIRPLPPVVPVERRTRPASVGWLASAAAAVLLVAGGLVWHPWTPGTPTQTDAVSRVVQAGDARTVRATIRGGGTAVVTRSKSQGVAALVATDLPTAPKGKVYELWLFDAKNNPHPAGLLPGNAEKRISVVLSGNAATAIAAGITVEPEGGSTAPTSKPIAALKFTA